MAHDPRGKSRVITEGPDRAPARSMLKAIGFTTEDLRRPIVGVANTWTETMPCNFHLRPLAVGVKEGVRAAGATPMEFNTISVSDGVTMGTEGMKASLVSREVIADSIELVGRGHLFDAMVTLVGCDKTIPAAAMALVRLNVPSLVLYGGCLPPGRFEGRDVTIQDVFEAVGAHSAGKMSLERLTQLEDVACPGAGACGGQYTANTMALATEFLGLSPPGYATIPAVDPRKDQASKAAGRLVVELLNQNLCPRDVLSRASFENAIAGVAATGGSTTAGRERARDGGAAVHSDREEGAVGAGVAGKSQAGDVVVIRYEGPRGGPGMREIPGVTAALVGRGLGESVALITDGRFSGATR